MALAALRHQALLDQQESPANSDAAAAVVVVAGQARPRLAQVEQAVSPGVVAVAVAQRLQRARLRRAALVAVVS